MKLSAFVAIAAVIGGSFLIPNPAQSSVFIDLNTRQRVYINDGRDGVIVKKEAQSVISHSSQAKYPIPSNTEKSGRYLLRDENVSQISLNGPVSQFGLNKEGSYYTIEKLTPARASVWTQKFYNMTTFKPPAWSVGSITR